MRPPGRVPAATNGTTSPGTIRLRAAASPGPEEAYQAAGGACGRSAKAPIEDEDEADGRVGRHAVCGGPAEQVVDPDQVARDGERDGGRGPGAQHPGDEVAARRAPICGPAGRRRAA